jgi:hypothetical protein
MNQIVELKLQDGTVVAFVDWSDIPLRSVLDILHGSTQQDMQLFNYVTGDVVPASAAVAVTGRASTEQDTNLSTPGAMADTEEMMIYAILPKYRMLRAATPEDGDPVDMASATAVAGTGMPNPNPVALGILGHGLTLQLEISEKVYADAPLAYYNSGFGPDGSGSTMGAAAAAGRTYANAGRPGRDAVRTFAIPYHIGGQEKYRVNIQNFPATPLNFGNSENGAVATDALAVMQLMIILDGLYKRPTS